MPRSIPTLCGSLAGTPFTVNVKVHTPPTGSSVSTTPLSASASKDPEGAIKAMRTLGIRGLNVTMPHKQAVIPFLDALDDTAREINAVNTIDNRDGFLTGYNTDCIGAVRALEGSGLASRSAPCVARLPAAPPAPSPGARGRRAHASRCSTARQTVARRLARDFGWHSEATSVRSIPPTSDGVVNATAAGFGRPTLNPLAPSQLAAPPVRDGRGFHSVRTK